MLKERPETMAGMQPETEVDADKHQIRKGAMAKEERKWRQG